MGRFKKRGGEGVRSVLLMKIKVFFVVFPNPTK